MDMHGIYSPNVKHSKQKYQLQFEHPSHTYVCLNIQGLCMIHYIDNQDCNLVYEIMIEDH